MDSGDYNWALERLARGMIVTRRPWIAGGSFAKTLMAMPTGDERGWDVVEIRGEDDMGPYLATQDDVGAGDWLAFGLGGRSLTIKPPSMVN